VFLFPLVTKATKNTNNNKQKGACKQVQHCSVVLVTIIGQAIIVAIVVDFLEGTHPIIAYQVHHTLLLLLCNLY
jgi:hypothetical protein